MSINSYAVLVHIEDSPVCGDCFLGSVVRIMLPTPYTRHAHYDWGFLRSDTIYTLFHTRRIGRKFRQDGRHPSNCSCRCATPVAKPLTMDKTVYILGLSETVSKLLRLENTGNVRDVKTSLGSCLLFVAVVLPVFWVLVW